MPGNDQVDIELDPFRAEDHVPYEQLRTMRRECPVARIPVGWFLSRQAEVLEAVRQVDTFVASFRAPGVVVPEEEQFINEIAEPRHSRVRKIINASVAYHKAMRLEPFIRDLCDDYLDPLIARGYGDLVADFVVSIPVNVIAHLIGVPREDWQRFWRWSDEVVEGTYPTLYRTERGEGLAGARPHRGAPGGPDTTRRLSHPPAEERGRGPAPVRRCHTDSARVPDHLRQRDDTAPHR
jgi:cytochrome P450